MPGNLGRTCTVDLRSVPERSVVIDVDNFLLVRKDIRSVWSVKCDCGHRADEIGKGHQKCDYLVVTDGEPHHLILIEVKTGASDPDGDVVKGFSQLVCSGCVFLSVLEACSVRDVDWLMAGIVVTRVASVTDEAEPLRIEWSRRFRIRLKHVLSGTDLWNAAFGPDS